MEILVKMHRFLLVFFSVYKVYQDFAYAVQGATIIQKIKCKEIKKCHAMEYTITVNVKHNYVISILYIDKLLKILICIEIHFSSSDIKKNHNCYFGRDHFLMLL